MYYILQIEKERAKEDLEASTDANANELVARMVEALNAAMGISMVRCTHLMLKLKTTYNIKSTHTQNFTHFEFFFKSHI
jgi:hypothetical protein